jgi:hypothetical protein
MRIIEMGEVPPDHPMFTQGVSFVFRSELPEEHDDEDDAEDDET